MEASNEKSQNRFRLTGYGSGWVKSGWSNKLRGKDEISEVDSEGLGDDTARITLYADVGLKTGKNVGAILFFPNNVSLPQNYVNSSGRIVGHLYETAYPAVIETLKLGGRIEFFYVGASDRGGNVYLHNYTIVQL